MSSLHKVAITTGDVRGVGLEVTAKSLVKLKPQKDVLFFLFRHKKQNNSKYLKLIDKKFNRLVFHNLDQALVFANCLSKNSANTLIDIVSDDSEARWVLGATLACKHGLLDSLVTGPLSKKVTVDFFKSKKILGHTGIFRSVFPKENLYMAFVGEHFNVMLATDHISLSEVENTLTKKYFLSAQKAAFKFLKTLNTKKPLATLGLNPHRGENGLIGRFEVSFKKQKFLVPDAAFFKKNINHYGLFLCLYHDQGLIPFKMIHGQDSGVQVTVGLPFIRTSVDHGTAIDIFNKNIANYNSMLEAINLNIKLLKNTRGV